MTKATRLVFIDRYPLIGPSVWILSLQYFVAQFIAAANWPNPPYSWSKNTISDLGNTVCGVYNGRQVCSPMHVLMNISLILLGLFMALGASLIYREFRQSKYSGIAFSLIVLAGIGTVMVGLFPENSPGHLHEIGAFLPLVLGNISLVILGLTLALPKGIKVYTLLSGAVALVAMVLFLNRTFLGMHEGAVERFAAYPQTFWLIVFGIYMSKNRLAPVKAK